ncbi:MAG TPA: response regulator [Candidatus Sulfotelmatobacter sp.]|jgi:chemotaxis family two-component system response regulator Rcp1
MNPQEVLLVDDNPADITLASEALAESKRQSRRQIKISSVGDGAQAVDFLFRRGKYANQVRPNLVILDLNLPKKDGRAVLKELKADAELRKIPVVIFSSSQANDDVLGSYQLGANCYVSKPVSLKAYFAVLQSLEEFWFGLASLPREGE